MPLLSIITVCKNPGFSIVATVESVLSQSFKDYEYIVIDSCSSDGTVEYLKNLHSKKKINKLIIEKDKGIYQAINKGIRIAEGAYVGLVHAGDTYNQDVFRLLLPYFKNKEDIIYGSSNQIIQHNSFLIELSKNSFKNLKKKNSIVHTSSFVKKKLYNQVGLYEEKFVIAGDFDFFKKALEQKFKFTYVPFVISNIEFGGISTKIDYIFTSAKECAQVVFGSDFYLKKFIYFINYVFKSFIHLIKIKILLNIKLLKKIFF